MTRTIGRLAPSPTGAQHVGNARTYLLAWLLCRRDPQGLMQLRIEDLETPRIKAWAVDQIYEDLRWLGLDWDSRADQDCDAPTMIIQSQRRTRYQEVLQQLLSREVVYPCTCSRSDIAASSAPHESVLDGHVYPGNCRHHTSADCDRLRAAGRSFSLRFRTEDRVVRWSDGFFGAQQLNVFQSLGDFVIWRNDDQAAYQLAVVIDDHDSHVNQVVRGADLIYSTYRQLAIYQALAWEAPNYIHVPLVVGVDGKRLAKRHGDTRISQLREWKIEPSQLVGYLAWKSGLIERPQRLMPHELLSIDPLKGLSIDPLVFDLQSELRVLQSIRG